MESLRLGRSIGVEMKNVTYSVQIFPAVQRLKTVSPPLFLRFAWASAIAE